MEEERRDIRGLRISTFNIWMIIAAGILYIGLLLVGMYTTRRYEELVTTTDDYIRLTETADEVHAASDYLTEQVRLYVQTLNVEHARLYFEEANVTRRREGALAVMGEYSLGEGRRARLREAVRHSNQLMIREIYAMKLVAVAEGHDPALLPPEVNATRLEVGDLLLSPDEQIDKARAMMFDEVYQQTKATIYSYLSSFTQGVIDDTEGRLMGGLHSVREFIYLQRGLLSVLVVLNVVTFLVLFLLVAKPLRVFLQCVRDRSQFQEVGAFEFRYLARVYNDIYRRNKAIEASEAFLRQRAERDGLTGILNRDMFRQLSELLTDSGVPLALGLIDVDWFKRVNDTYGHAAGDRVLIRVAGMLKDCLRDSDHVFRVGGDEFAVILTEITEDNGGAIRDKLLQVNQRLAVPEEGCPAVSLSIGISFSESGYRPELYEQADQALYWVKEHGRCDCVLYSDQLAQKGLRQRG